MAKNKSIVPKSNKSPAPIENINKITTDFDKKKRPFVKIENDKGEYYKKERLLSGDIKETLKTKS